MSIKSNKYDASLPLQQHLVKYNTLWLKFSKPKMLTFLGRDVLAICNGCNLLIKNLITGAEHIVNINNYETVGNGVAAMAGHKSHPFVAYAEKREFPRVFLLTYPELKYSMVLQCQFYKITRLSISDAELLFGLSGYPECSLIVWKWRTGDVMATMATNMLFDDNVILKCSYTTFPIFLAQAISNTSEMKMWEIGTCVKNCILLSENVTFDHDDPRLKIVDLLWTSDGACYTIDNIGNVFKHDFVSSTMKIVIRSENGPGTSAFCWWSNGLVVQSADRKIRHYSKDNWELTWTLEHEHFEFVQMYSHPSKDYLIVRTKANDILHYSVATNHYQNLRGDEANITHFGFIPPQNDLLATLGKSTNLSLWDAKTGALVQSVLLDSKALCLCCNHYYPYIAISFETGLLKLYSCIKRTLEPLAQFHLSRIPLHQIKFFEANKAIAVANMDIGQIFIIEGVPGKKFKVLSAITHHAQIADFMATGAKTCLRLFIIPVTSDKFLAGNKIVRYCIIMHQEATVKTYELENPEHLYTALYNSGNHPRDRFLYATPFGNKNLHELEVKRGDTHARVVNRIKSFHMMRDIYYVFDPNFVLSYAYDGVVIIRGSNFDLAQVIIPHHRFDGGIYSCVYDPNYHRVITLGRDGILVCNELSGMVPMTTKQLAMLHAKGEELADMFRQPTIGFMPKGIYEGLCWLEYKELMKVESERIKFEKQRQKIVDDFNQVKQEAVILLNHNLDGPTNERLELQEFNLNLQHKEDLVKASREQCERLKYYLERLIQDQDRISMLIKEKFWDPIDVPTKNLWAIFGNFDVQSYCVLPPNLELSESLQKIEGYREIENLCAREDMFVPWSYLTDEEIEAMKGQPPKLCSEKSRLPVYKTSIEEETSEEKLEREDLFENIVAYNGSTVPMYLPTSETQYDQAEVESFYQQSWCYIISVDQQNQLRDYFNQEFEIVVQAKIREMGTIIERNARLRYIISEINYFSDDKLEMDPIDPEWRQDETPEFLCKVDNSEVGIMPYISPSEQALLDTKAAEEERIRLLLLADDFKERALMKMMNGVLEVRWEDELRRHVPRPKCFSEKNPEDFNEEDLRTIKEYEEACSFLDSERERYKSLLVVEHNKMGNMLRDGVKKFNDKLQDLLVKKIQIQSALANELLRMHRMRVQGLQKNQLDEVEEQAEENITLNDAKIEELTTLISSLNFMGSDLKTVLETLLLREKFIDKNFKREFQDYTSAQFELLSKLYKKRPKSNLRLVTSPSTLQEMSRVVQTGKPSLLLFGDPRDFGKFLDTMDKYVGIPPIIDEALYASMCRLRRLKIEIELKIRSCQLEISDAENTEEMYQQHLATCKERSQQLIQKLEDVRSEKLNKTLNIEMQLVLKQAFVELPRVGSLKDFEDAIMVNRKDVEDINAIIQQTGAKKIKAMRNAMQFRKEIMMKEWQHQRKKMEISDYEHQFDDIKSIKLTKELQQYLKMRSRGEVEKIVSYEHEVEMLKDQYSRHIQMRRDEVNDLKEKLETLVVEKDRLNLEISKVNIDVNEASLLVDEDLSEKEKKLVNMRIQANLKRSRLVNQIQVNHNEILVLQAQLELCRLKTVPILDYKVY